MDAGFMCEEYMIPFSITDTADNVFPFQHPFFEF